MQGSLIIWGNQQKTAFEGLVKERLAIPKYTNHLPNGHINFKKFWEISRQIHEFMTWTQVECPFEKDKKIQSYLLTAPIYSEEGERPPPLPPRHTL